MIHIKAPDPSSIRSYPRIFLAGSIEMGKAGKWQDRVAEELKDTKVTILNPRRDDWDSSWVQDPAPGTQFHEQVTWELTHMLQSDFVFFNFEADTKSPITLMELGLIVGTRKRAVVRCPKKFWRHGNVVLTSNIASIPVVETMDEALAELRTFLKM